MTEARVRAPEWPDWQGGQARQQGRHGRVGHGPTAGAGQGPAAGLTQPLKGNRVLRSGRLCWDSLPE